MTEETLRKILLKLLDWPFLFTILLVGFAWRFRAEVRALLSRGDIRIAWGEGRSIELRELSESLDKDLQPIQDELDGLRQEVESLRAALGARQTDLMSFSVPAEEGLDAAERMRNALADESYRWRSLSRLAQIVGLTEEETLIELRKDPQVVLGADKQGRRIARLANR